MSDLSSSVNRHLGACRISGPDACGEILLVGEDNPLSMDPRYALYHEPRNCTGQRLQSKILGLRPRQSYLPIWRTNLCIGGWDADAAQDRAIVLLGEDAPWRIIVMLGAKVSGAFTRASGTHVATFSHSLDGRSGRQVRVSLPHPSGRNPIWNDLTKVDLARSILRGVAPGVLWGEIDGSIGNVAGSDVDGRDPKADRVP